ncbi:MFS transporter [Muricoccus vinaceus]
MRSPGRAAKEPLDHAGHRRAPDLQAPVPRAGRRLVGTGLATVALGLLAYDLAEADAGLVLGTALAIKMVAYVAVAPVASAFAHRLPRRTMLVALDLVRAAVALLLPFVSEIWHVYVLIFVLQSAPAAFTPTFQATIPDILPDEAEYTRALSLSQLAYDKESVISPMLAAALLTVIGFYVLFAATVVGFLVSAALVVSVVLLGLKPAEPRGIYDRTTRGIRIYLATPRLCGLLVFGNSVTPARWRPPARTGRPACGLPCLRPPSWGRRRQAGGTRALRGSKAVTEGGVQAREDLRPEAAGERCPGDGGQLATVSRPSTASPRTRPAGSGARSGAGPRAGTPPAPRRDDIPVALSMPSHRVGSPGRLGGGGPDRQAEVRQPSQQVAQQHRLVAVAVGGPKPRLWLSHGTSATKTASMETRLPTVRAKLVRSRKRRLKNST